MLGIIKSIGRIAPYYLAISIPIFIILLINSLLFLKPIDKDSKEKISFEIVEDSKKDQIATILKKNGLARSSFAISILIKREQTNRDEELVLYLWAVGSVMALQSVGGAEDQSIQRLDDQSAHHLIATYL